MIQKLETEPEKINTLLLNVLVKHSLIDGKLIEDLIKKRDRAVDSARKEIQGIEYIIDYQNKSLNISDTYTGELLNSVPLPGNHQDFNHDDFASWGNGFSIINNVELQKEGELPYDKKSSYGLVVSKGRAYLSHPDLEKQSILAITNQYIFGAIPRKHHIGLPFDMYFSDDYSFLCISSRDEGKIYVFDIRSSKFTDEIIIRKPGLNKTINLAISAADKKIYITDNISPLIFIYDLKNKVLNKKNLNMGILGNLVLSPDQKSLYMIILKPEQSLKNIDCTRFSEIKTFPPKGELFSIGDAPCDLISLSPDKNHLFWMSFINDPNPFTPVISVIDTHRNKAIKRFSDKDGLMPLNICTEDINPIGPLNKSLEEIIVENRLFSINKLREIKNAILNGSEDPFDEQGKDFVEIEGEELKFELRHDKSASGDYNTVVPKKMKRIILPERANKHIKECLVNSFWQKHEIDLSTIEEIQENLDKLVNQVRHKLEDYNLEIVEIKGFYDKKMAMEAVILREFILEMLDEEDSEDRQKVKTVPTNCPNCGAMLLGSWDCSTCGFEIERPEDALRRKIASADHLANLAKGNFLVMDTLNGEVFELDSFKVPVWKASKYQLGLKSISAVQRLENMNTMILDGEAGEIIEISPKGRQIRRLTISDENFDLKYPASFTIVNYDHFLIADTGNHRVIESDLSGNIVWDYGKPGSPGIKEGYLNNPSYIQKTYDATYLITDTGNDRIIELNREINPGSGKYEMKIIWEFGGHSNIIEMDRDLYSLSLNEPAMAIKELSGNVLILDAGNKRVIEVSPDKEINWQYNTETDNPETSISFPSRFTRLKNKDILLVGDGKYVQFMPSANNRIVWVSSRRELSERTAISIVPEQVTKIKVKYGSAPQIRERVPRYKIRDPIELEKELQEIVAKRYMEAVIPPPRWLDSEHPKSFLSPGKSVQPLPVLLVDKVNNKVMLSDRQAHVFWSYGDDKVEKLVRVKMADISPEKTVLITNAKGVMEIFHPQLSAYYIQSKHEYSLSKKDLLVSDVSERIWVYPCHAESAVRIKNGNTLISDSKKFRVIEVNKKEEIVWEHYHRIRVAIASYANRLENGNTLISYSSAHIVVEVSPEHEIVWSFGKDNTAFNDGKHLCFPEYARRLENGNTLIADTKNSRIIEVDKSGEIVWEFSGNRLIKLISPNYAERLTNGNTYIIHGGNREALEIDSEGETVWKLLLPLRK